MPSVSLRKLINAPAGELWEAVRAFEQFELLLPGVPYTVEGTGVGCCRIFQLPDGAQITERLLARDDQSRMLRYEIVEPSSTPWSNYSAVMAVRDVDDSRAEVEWSARFDVRDMPEPAVVEMIEQFLGSTLDGLNQRHSR